MKTAWQGQLTPLAATAAHLWPISLLSLSLPSFTFTAIFFSSALFISLFAHLARKTCYQLIRSSQLGAQTHTAVRENEMEERREKKKRTKTTTNHGIADDCPQHVFFKTLFSLPPSSPSRKHYTHLFDANHVGASTPNETERGNADLLIGTTGKVSLLFLFLFEVMSTLPPPHSIDLLAIVSVYVSV